MEWISVKDREPPKDKSFLAYTGNEFCVSEWIISPRNSLDKRGWWVCSNSCDCCSGCCGVQITHWMPLPEPPNG